MYKVNIKRLIAKAEPILAQSRREKEQREYEAECARLEEIRRKQQEEYDKPLPDFPPKIARGTRVALLRYIARVFNDAVRLVLERESQDEMRDQYRFAKFEDRPVQEFSVAIRIAELKPITGSSKIDSFGVLYIVHSAPHDPKLEYVKQHRGFSMRVVYRVKQNLFDNLPIFKQILGNPFDVRMRVSSDELKKSGYKAEPGEKGVVHLEIF